MPMETGDRSICDPETLCFQTKSIPGLYAVLKIISQVNKVRAKRLFTSTYIL